ncbi:MAG: hypothetical protein ABEK29_07410, partial [Bradymonadaceae bacterium]
MRRMYWPLMAAATIWLMAAGCGPPQQPCAHGDCPGRDTGTHGRDTSPSCSGCLLKAGGKCVDGTEARACGRGGGLCTACGDGEVCNDGRCEAAPCSPETCDGCCYDGECQPGVKDFACGSGGQRCGTCPESKHCTPEGRCVDCTDGCWADNGACREGTTDEACGSGGETCASCGSEKTCEEGDCVEPAGESCSQSCMGCCQGDQCK